LRRFCDAFEQVPHMLDLVPYFVIDFVRQDPLRALGLAGLACVAISLTTSFDLLAALGFVEVEDRSDKTTSVA
jgi:hypothetical protein